MTAMQDKTAIVAGFRFGAVIARVCPAAGVRVVIADLNGDAVCAVSAKIDGAATVCGVADNTPVRPLTSHVAVVQGDVDMTVNTAGITHILAPMPDLRAKFPDKFPMGRFPTPGDLGAAATVLCNDAGGLITGTAFAIDKGRCI